ncbi:MAG: hypothetical protein J6R12_01540 [Bacteroidales bacterium]|nr:hypothetical protein [Bacteroidales bacterium]
MSIFVAMGTCVTFASIVFIRNEYKYKILETITKYMACLLSISLCFYVIRLLGFSLPFEIIQKDDLYGQELNYYFFLLDGDGEIFRFKGPFLEPGYLTLGVAPLLFLNKYNIKNIYVLLLLVVQLFSFSLAGYICLILGVVLRLLLLKKTVLTKIRLFISLVILMIIMLSTAKIVVGEDVFNTLILERLEWNKDTGTIAGNNRYTPYFEQRYKQFLKSEDLLVGSGWDYSLSQESGNSGYKVFLFNQGLIGLVLSIFMYTSTIIRNHDRKNILFVIFLMILMYQNAYPTMWALLICYVYGSQSLLEENFKRIKQ